MGVIGTIGNKKARNNFLALLLTIFLILFFVPLLLKPHFLLLA